MNTNTISVVYGTTKVAYASNNGIDNGGNSITTAQNLNICLEDLSSKIFIIQLVNDKSQKIIQECTLSLRILEKWSKTHCLDFGEDYCGTYAYHLLTTGESTWCLKLLFTNLEQYLVEVIWYQCGKYCPYSDGEEDVDEIGAQTSVGTNRMECDNVIDEDNYLRKKDVNIVIRATPEDAEWLNLPSPTARPSPHPKDYVIIKK